MKNNPPEYTDEPQLEKIQDSEEEKKRLEEEEDKNACIRDAVLKILK